MNTTDEETPVHVGWWYDHDLNRLQGYRLTLTNENARFLRTFLVMAVAFSGKRCWEFVSFLLYRYTASRRLDRDVDVDAIREQQVILRNLETAPGTFFHLLKLPFIRRSAREAGRRSSKPFLRLLLLAIALVHYFAFIGFGFLVGFADVGNIVRSHSTSSCGLWETVNKTEGNSRNRTFLDTRFYFHLSSQRAILDAESYAESCVRESGSESEGCKALYRASLPYRTYNSTCAYGLWCERNDTASAFVMESKNASFSDLGFNTPFSPNLYISYKQHCSPLAEWPFLINQANISGYDEFKALNDALQQPERIIGYIHVKGSRPHFYFNHRQDENFVLTYDTLYSGWTNCYPPLCPESRAMTGSVITLHPNAMFFPRPLYDAFFFAPKATAVTYGKFIGVGSTLYIMDRAINSVACTESTRFCSDITEACTPWTGFGGGDPDVNHTSMELLDSFSALLLGNKHDWFDLDYLGVMTLIRRTLWQMPVSQLISIRGASLLRAPRGAVGIEMHNISDEQWKIELEWWFQIALARLHRAPLRMFENSTALLSSNSTVRLTPVKAEDSRNTTSTEEAAHSMWTSVCSKIKFRSSKHTTFSAIGIALVLIGALVLTVLSFIDLILEHWWKHAPTQLRGWREDDVVELLQSRNRFMKECGCTVEEGMEGRDPFGPARYEVLWREEDGYKDNVKETKR